MLLPLSEMYFGTLEKSLFKVGNFFHFSFLCKAARLISHINITQMEKLKLHIHVYNRHTKTYMCICLHVCVSTFLCALIGSPTPALARGEPAAGPHSDSEGGGNPQTSAAKVLNVQDTVTDLVAYLQAVSGLGSTYTMLTQLLSPQRL